MNNHEQRALAHSALLNITEAIVCLIECEAKLEKLNSLSQSSDISVCIEQMEITRKDFLADAIQFCTLHLNDLEKEPR